MAQRWRILVADDENAVRRLVVTTLGTVRYEVLEASNGEDALRIAREWYPDLALLDVNMPVLDGFEVCQALRDDPATASIPIILLTARATAEDQRQALEAGVDGYFTKPFSPVRLLDRITSMLERQEKDPGEEPDKTSSSASVGTAPPNQPDLADQPQLLLYAQDLGRAYRELHSTYDATLEALVGALDVRDHQTEGHSQRVVELCVAMAKQLGINGSVGQDLRRGAVLHDVGKIGIPDAILHKPGPLDAQEWAEMRKHPEHGYRILSGVPFLTGCLDVVLYHHERWDGRGYPRGLGSDQIPITARTFALADSWDAMRSDRPYRRALPVEHAKEQIRRNAGLQFDPALAELFLQSV